MVEARLNQASVLKKILDAIKDVVTDANLDCSPTGISLQTMDPSHVSLVFLLLRKQGFSEYECKRNKTLGVNLQSVSKILKCAANDDTVTIKADQDGDHVTFVFESSKAEKVSQFQLKLMDIESELLSIPDQEYDAEVTLPASDFHKICKDLSNLGESVVISVEKQAVKFSTSGDLGKGNTQLNRTSDADAKPEESVVIKAEEPVSLTFALRYLNQFTKATSLSSTVTLKMSKDVPLVVEYSIEQLGHVRYFLAPKIDDDNN